MRTSPLARWFHRDEPPYTPSNPPTLADWQYIERRSDASRRRSRHGVQLGIVSLVIVITIGVLGAVIYFSQRDVPKVLDNQTVTLNKINELVRGLQHAEADRTAASKDNAIALAVIVEGLARFAATPPYPDPARVEAVQTLCGIAGQFRKAVDAPTAVCP